MARDGHITARGVVLLVVIAVVGLTIAGFVLAHAGGGHGIERLF